MIARPAGGPRAGAAIRQRPAPEVFGVGGPCARSVVRRRPEAISTLGRQSKMGPGLRRDEDVA
jgi:hypothetical protein